MTERTSGMTNAQEKLNAAMAIREALAALLTMGVQLSEQETEEACKMYTEASIIVWRLSPE